MARHTYWTTADFQREPYAGLKVGDVVECCHRRCVVDVQVGKRGVVKRLSRFGSDVVRVLWDGVEDDPFNENAQPINVRNLVLIKQGV